MLHAEDTVPFVANNFSFLLSSCANSNLSSEFVDTTFTAYKDQWQVLASTKKLAVTALEKLAATYNFKEAPNRETPSLAPWERNLPEIASISGCPQCIEVVLANRIYIPIESMPNALVARLKKLASFSNPKFFKAQGLRLSTNGIPRYNIIG